MPEVLVINGVEDTQGRALFVISALYHCADFLKPYLIRFIDVQTIPVEIAAEVLAFDTGLSVEISRQCPILNPENAFRDAAMYAAVVFEDVSGLGLQQAHDSGVPKLVAIQFPKPSDWSAGVISRLASAHDPVIFAQSLRDSLM